MRTLAQRVNAAIRASGKTAAKIAREIGTSKENLGKIRSGENDNPHYQLLVKLAAATNTTVAVLAGESIPISPTDRDTLVGFRDWINGKLATIDALTEPNAEIIPAEELAEPVIKIADAIFPQPSKRFGSTSLFLRALGDSMRDAGIFAGDMLYVATQRRNTAESWIGKIIACRIGEHLYVKRLTSERQRHFLLSENPHYLAIDIAPDDPRLKILGVVAGRTGRVK